MEEETITIRKPIIESKDIGQLIAECDCPNLSSQEVQLMEYGGKIIVGLDGRGIGHIHQNRNVVIVYCDCDHYADLFRDIDNQLHNRGYNTYIKIAEN
jgi:hypothetical protein